MPTPPPPIPVSRRQRWREFRHRVLPFLLFAGSLALVTVLWRRSVAPPMFVATAEADQTEVRSVAGGWLSSLDVEVLQPVEAGAVLGHVVTTDPRVLEASLGVARAELQLLTASLEPALNQQRIAVDRDRLNLEWMQQRVELASLRVRVTQAASDLARSAKLHAQHMVTDQEHELARTTHDELTAQLHETMALVAKLAPKFDATAPEAIPTPSVQGTLSAALRLEEEKVRLIEAQLSPQPLRAPRGGVVSAVFRRAGEGIVSGESIVRITGTRPLRLVGYLRQPLPLEPRPGMLVEVRSRQFQRRVAQAKIVQVGTAMEFLPAPVLAAMRIPVTAEPSELGLRIHLSPVEELGLRPGEIADGIIVK
ncbi:HlyD family secretion protein [Opitutus sp. ER46]|uniref:HlyD family secretion protein n=1 Tax=Opitutus sp. ER46 TaxID=2161864 RepID=UPI000D317ED8|nr:HlyD family secretion protein [Opitutus sp. ER46]PTX98453.1 hypothetical protein DB354_04075 [Opitutus sp. ER46]